jgi:hypothetical protein
MEELVLFPSKYLEREWFPHLQTEGGKLPVLYKMDTVHGRLKCRSMADAEVINDASAGSLCCPPSLALKRQGEGLGLLVLVEPALITKGAKESCLLGMKLCEINHDVYGAGLAFLVAWELTPPVLAACLVENES